MKPRVTWNYTDDTYCRHGALCASCEATEDYMVGVVIESDDSNIGDRIAAPFGESWEAPPEGGAYVVCTVHAVQSVEEELELAGFDPQEG